MQVRVDVYTKDMDAALDAYQKAIKAGAHDVALNSNHDYESKELEYFNLMYNGDHSMQCISELDEGPFKAEYSDL